MGNRALKKWFLDPDFPPGNATPQGVNAGIRHGLDDHAADGPQARVLGGDVAEQIALEVGAAAYGRSVNSPVTEGEPTISGQLFMGLLH